MSYTPITIPCASRVICAAAMLILLLAAFSIFGQTQRSNEISELLPDQTLERGLVGAETHRYKFDLQANEFFQVRVEQKGVDVTLKLFDANHKILATMDSPNEKQGPETLTFVAERSSSFVLEVTGLDAKADKGNYSIRRATQRQKTANDTRRVELERVFVEGVAAREVQDLEQATIAKLETALSGWQELQDSYMAEMTTQQIRNIKEAQFRRDARPLSVGETVERQIKGGQIHPYSFELKAGAVLQLDARERDIDVAIAVFDGASEGPIAKADFGSGNDRETLTFIAKADGPYMAGLIARSSPGGGSYQLTARASETATAADKDRIEAERLMVEGAEIGNSDDATVPDPKIAKWENALMFWQKIHDDYWEAYTSQLLGSRYEKIGDKRKALDHYDHALSLFQAVGDRKREIAILKSTSALYLSLGEPRKAAESLSQEALLWKLEQNKFEEVLAYQACAKIYLDLGEIDPAIENYRKALPIYQELKLNDQAIITYGLLASVSNALARHDEAIKYAELALAVDETMPDDLSVSQRDNAARMIRKSKAMTQTLLGGIYTNRREWEKALRHLNLALGLSEHDNDDAWNEGTFITIMSIGQVYFFRYEWDKALASYNKALSLAKETDNKKGIALVVNQIGAVFIAISDDRKAIGYFEQAIEASRAIPDRNIIEIRGEANALNNIGISYHNLGEPQKALEYYNRSLILQKQTNPSPTANDSSALDNNILAVVLRTYGDSRDQIATTYNNMAGVYMSLNDYQKAIDLLNLAQETYRQTASNVKSLARNHSTEAKIIVNLGIAHSDLFGNREGLTYYNQALEMGLKVGDKSIEAFALKSMAIGYMKLGETKSALEHMSKSLNLYRELGERAEEAMLLTGLGAIYDILGERQKALEHHDLALSLSRKIEHKQIEVIALSNKAATYTELGESISFVLFLWISLMVSV
jgi:tetratricopeptide (TPR) repeat protein